jgi:acyl CoA:acetate/3-ketoacid CoA transferase beta subunit
VTPEGLLLDELADGVATAEVQAVTQARLIVSPKAAGLARQLPHSPLQDGEAPSA